MRASCIASRFAPAGRALLLGRGVAPTLGRRPLAGAPSRALSGKVPITFVDKDGSVILVQASEGKSLLEVAHENDIELEGACDGSLACSTCHLILDEQTFAKLKAPEEEELDMLDLAFDLRPTCALGCQVKVKPELAGMTCTLPAGSNNMEG
ncbi:2Fe-2S ferredoxin-type domain-containing protein [Pavlovales sp. CCMP2436]|nr:2Fe-2S ferredoxin-type domain-containing protein [Pavlovales sp. CCMP2436]